MTNSVSWTRPTLENAESDARANWLEAVPAHVQGRSPAPNGNCGGQLPAELIAHLVIALSRYRRQIRTEGGRVPPQIENVITFLADRAKARHDVLMLDPWRAGSEACSREALLAR